jgi:uncharacterized tellurite resistance protein B-like protein
MIDVVLMAALADGDLTDEERDRIGRAIRDVEDLHGLDWDWVLARGDELALEAPLFFDARQTLDRLTDPARRRSALTIAANVVAADRPLFDEERALLGSVARRFDIEDDEFTRLIEPSRLPGPGRGFERSRFNDPTLTRKVEWVDALQDAENEGQRRLLLYKLAGLRLLTWTAFADDEARVIRVGERLRFGAYVFRVDGVLEVGTRRWLCRFLAPAEALHPGEQPMIRTLADRLPETAAILVAHFGQLSPADASFLQGFDPRRVHRVELQDPLSGGASA